MRRLFTMVSISQRWFSLEVWQDARSFEIEKDVNGELAGIRLQPMADIFIVHWQLAEDLLLMGLQFDQELFELCLVENGAGREGPSGMNPAFASWRKPGKNHFATVILRAFMNGDRVGNGVSLIVVRRSDVEFRFEIAAMGVFFTNAIPAGFDLHAVGNFSALETDPPPQRAPANPP